MGLGQPPTFHFGGSVAKLAQRDLEPGAQIPLVAEYPARPADGVHHEFKDQTSDLVMRSTAATKSKSLTRFRTVWEETEAVLIAAGDFSLAGNEGRRPIDGMRALGTW